MPFCSNTHLTCSDALNIFVRQSPEWEVLVIVLLSGGHSGQEEDSPKSTRDKTPMKWKRLREPSCQLCKGSRESPLTKPRPGGLTWPNQKWTAFQGQHPTSSAAEAGEKVTRHFSSSSIWPSPPPTCGAPPMLPPHLSSGAPCEFSLPASASPGLRAFPEPRKATLPTAGLGELNPPWEQPQPAMLWNCWANSQVPFPWVGPFWAGLYISSYVSLGG